MQRRQQGIGLGQAADAVEGERVAHLGFAEEAAGIAGDEGDQHQLGRPLRGVLEADTAGPRPHHPVRNAEGEGARHGQTQGEAKAAGEAGGHDGADDGEDERRVPVAGGRHGDDGEAQLAEELQEAPRVVLVVAEGEERADGCIDDERRSPEADGALQRPPEGGDDEADDNRAPTDARDERREGRQPVSGV